MLADLPEWIDRRDPFRVLAKDVVTSINRWAAREQMGLMIRAIQNELTAVDDRTFRLFFDKLSKIGGSRLTRSGEALAISQICR